jgi:hypothetical protein
MLYHRLDIDPEGDIEITFPPDGLKEKFKAEPDAVTALVESMIKIGDRAMQFSDRCNSPVSTARPGFSKDRFVEAVVEAIGDR